MKSLPRLSVEAFNFCCYINVFFPRRSYLQKDMQYVTEMSTIGMGCYMNA